MPRTLRGWAMFILAVYAAGIVINTIAKRVPVVAQIGEGV